VAFKEHLPRGRWIDVDNRFLPCMFDTLVKFVEGECSHMYDLSQDHPKLSNKEAGIAHLRWEMTILYDENNGFYKGDPLYGKLSSQGEAAKEILGLYLWWTEIYPSRPDSYDHNGWEKYCNKRNSLLKNYISDFKVLKKFSDSFTAMNINEEYDKEDTEMMIRLIKIRQALWT
jgi:hypothetical protein